MEQFIILRTLISIEDRKDFSKGREIQKFLKKKEDIKLKNSRKFISRLKFQNTFRTKKDQSEEKDICLPKNRRIIHV